MSAFYGLRRRTTRGGTMTTLRDLAPTRRVARLTQVAAAALFVAACAGNTQPQMSHGQGMSCLDDSAHCIAQRQTALRHLVSRSDRHWVNDQAGPDAYASGVRLFAFKTKKRELSCNELMAGRREAEGAGKVLRGPQGRSLSPAQIARGVMLAEEVSRELAREHSRRCRRG